MCIKLLFPLGGVGYVRAVAMRRIIQIHRNILLDGSEKKEWTGRLQMKEKKIKNKMKKEKQ